MDLLIQRTSFFWEEVLSILIITHLLWSTNVTPRRSFAVRLAYTLQDPKNGLGLDESIQWFVCDWGGGVQ